MLTALGAVAGETQSLVGHDLVGGGVDTGTDGNTITVNVSMAKIIVVANKPWGQKIRASAPESVGRECWRGKNIPANED